MCPNGKVVTMACEKYKPENRCHNCPIRPKPFEDDSDILLNGEPAFLRSCWYDSNNRIWFVDVEYMNDEWIPERRTGSYFLNQDNKWEHLSKDQIAEIEYRDDDVEL